MSSQWDSGSASDLTRGLSSITEQISNNLKEILTEASEEHYDPTAELTRARLQIEDLELRKQAVEIKSDMLLAENRRTIEEKDV